MELYVEEYGPHAAPTIVFLNGGGGANWMWQPQIDRLADYLCLAPDLPGHGKSAALNYPQIQEFTMGIPTPLVHPKG
jgi:pimeloyl-ACP methyl ester carboxylesterase